MVRDLNICIKSEKISFVFVFRLKRRKSCTAEPLSPMGRVLIFFSGMRLSLSALLNIGNETSRGLVSVCLWFASFQHNAGRCRRSLEHLQSSCLLLINAFFFHESSQVSFIYVAQHHRSDKKKHFFSSIFLRLSKRLESQEYSIFQSCPPSTFKQMRCILYTFSYKHNPPKGALSPSNTNTVAISSKIQQVLTGCSSL